MAEVNAVSLKLPIFWPDDVALWFAHIEAQFAIRNITAEDTRYYYVVSALDRETARRLRSTLAAPPSQGKYTNIKAQLTKTFTMSKRQRALRMIEMQDLGDKKPSEFMDELLALMDNHEHCLLFEIIFLRALPPSVRMLLEEADFTDPREVAIRADALYATHCTPITSKAVNMVATPNQEEKAPNEKNLATVKFSKRKAGRTRPTSPRFDVTKLENNGLCFYHSRFGAKANKCISGCGWPGNGLPDHQ